MSEWGPWIEHDGKGCPLPIGTVVEAKCACGCVLVGTVGSSGTVYHPYDCVYAGETWVNSWRNSPGYHVPFRAYRTRRYPAATRLIEQATRIPVAT